MKPPFTPHVNGGISTALTTAVIRHPFAPNVNGRIPVTLSTEVGRILFKNGFHPARPTGEPLWFTHENDFLPEDCMLGILVNHRFLNTPREFLGVVLFKSADEWVFEVYGNLKTAKKLADKLKKEIGKNFAVSIKVEESPYPWRGNPVEAPPSED